MKRLPTFLLVAAITLSACGSPDSDATLSSEASATTVTTAPTSGSPTTTTTLSTTTSAPPETTLPSFPTGIEPTRISIPAIDVDAKVVDLDLGRANPEVPSNFADAGWYTATRNPGEIGPSVIAGHIDSRSGPAVFFRLDELVEGDEIIVSDENGEARRFFVVDSGQYPKSDLPREVFGFGEAEPELRLITCGGTFDSAVGHYQDNYVVYARADV